MSDYGSVQKEVSEAEHRIKVYVDKIKSLCQENDVNNLDSISGIILFLDEDIKMLLATIWSLT